MSNFNELELDELAKKILGYPDEFWEDENNVVSDLFYTHFGTDMDALNSIASALVLLTVPFDPPLDDDCTEHYCFVEKVDGIGYRALARRIEEV